MDVLHCWQATGNCIALFIDSNEHVLNDHLAWLLSHPSIELNKVSHDFWSPEAEHNTHINGSLPIDGIYAMPEIDLQSFLVLSFHEEVKDHQMSIIDISTESMIEQFQGHIVCPTLQ